MLEYNPLYVKSIGTNEFYFLDTTRSAEETKYTTRIVQHVRNAGDTAEERVNMVSGNEPNYKKDFASRKALLGLSTKVIAKFLLTDNHFLNHWRINYFQIQKLC